MLISCSFQFCNSRAIQNKERITQTISNYLNSELQKGNSLTKVLEVKITNYRDNSSDFRVESSIKGTNFHYENVRFILSKDFKITYSSIKFPSSSDSIKQYYR